jgi:sucrose-6-phosphate hydrolase SacC (GH32 family)
MSSLDPSVDKTNVTMSVSGCLQVFVDHSVVEMFSCDGLNTAAFRVYPTLIDSVGVSMVSMNANTTFNLDAWMLFTANSTSLVS